MLEFHEITARVRYAETDQMGVVYHANYLIWMEMGRVEYCRAAGVRYRDLEREAGVYLAVADVHCRYLAPARYDDEILIRTRIEQAHSRMVTFHYDLRHRETGRALAAGATKHVFLDRELKPCKLPAQYWPVFGISGRT